MANRKRLWEIKRFLNTTDMVVTWSAYDVSGDEPKPIDGFHARCEAGKLSEANRQYAMLHGINQTCSDTAALPSGAGLKEKFEYIRERIAHLESGSEVWTSERQGEGSILFAALMLEKPERDPVKLRAKLRELGPSKQAAMLNRPTEALRPFIEQVRAERGKQVDTDELFAELDA